METLKVRIQSLKDAANGIPVVEGITPENAIECKDFTVCIQEAGTVSGQTTLMFLLKTPEGKFAYGQCTANHFRALNKALEGAVERFGK